jgi:hypothetical protein
MSRKTSERTVHPTAAASQVGCAARTVTEAKP